MRSRSFSIYLLKEGFGPTNALKDDHRLEEGVEANELPEGAVLYVLNNQPHDPWWKAYFGVRKSLKQVTKGALVFLPVGDRWFALSFGFVFHNLKDESYEYDFGIRVTLNSLDPNKLKSTDVLEPGAARRQRTQVPIESNLTYFDFDRDSAILKSLTGKVKDEHKDLFRSATGASSLHISSPIAPDGLIELCEKLLELYESEQFKTTFPDIQNITPVRDPERIGRLNGKLLTAFRDKAENLSFSIPAIIDYHHNAYAAFKGAGASRIYDDVFIGRYYEYLEENGKGLRGIDLDDLKRHTVRLTDEEGNPRQRFPIFKCLIFDTTLGSGTEVYHLVEGDWYKVESDYIARLKAFLDPLYSELPFPAFNHAGEGAYNKAVAAGDDQFVCLDKGNIAPAGQTQIEPCDLYTSTGGHANFGHIKISTFSAELSHLFNQGTNAIELLKLDGDAVSRLEALITKRRAGQSTDGFFEPLGEQRFRVAFGIITHKDKNRRSDNLPLFSRISLMRSMKTLQIMGVGGSYGFIEDQTPRKQGKKKIRKNKRPRC